MKTIWRRAAPVAVSTALLALACALALAPAASAGGAHASVIGGKSVKIEEYPWLAFIEGDVETDGVFPFSCTGTVIAPRVVLTAGHCVEDLEVGTISPTTGYRVATGVTSNKRVPRAHVSGVTKALVYPGFRPITDHGDAGLLILSRPTAAPALALAGPEDAGLLSAGTPIEIAGWGVSDFRTERSRALLQATGLVVQPPERCRKGKTEYHRDFNPALQLCALDKPDFDSSGCFGDSGGPAIAHRADGTPVELGIVNSGGYECEPKIPNLYARVDTVSSWASRWIAAVELGAPEPALARLQPPPMNDLEAVFLAERVVNQDFGPIARLRSLNLHCRAASATRFRCHADWVAGPNRYFGQIVVFYTPHIGPVTWNDTYRIKRGRTDCLTGPAPKRCPLHTRIHRAGKPKRV